jgi:hypothetical protein
MAHWLRNKITRLFKNSIFCLLTEQRVDLLLGERVGVGSIQVCKLAAGHRTLKKDFADDLHQVPHPVPDFVHLGARFMKGLVSLGDFVEFNPDLPHVAFLKPDVLVYVAILFTFWLLKQTAFFFRHVLLKVEYKKGIQ